MGLEQAIERVDDAGSRRSDLNPKHDIVESALEIETRRDLATRHPQDGQTRVVGHDTHRRGDRVHELRRKCDADDVQVSRASVDDHGELHPGSNLVSLGEVLEEDHLASCKAIGEAPVGQVESRECRASVVGERDQHADGRLRESWKRHARPRQHVPRTRRPISSIRAHRLGRALDVRKDVRKTIAFP